MRAVAVALACTLNVQLYCMDRGRREPVFDKASPDNSVNIACIFVKFRRRALAQLASNAGILPSRACFVAVPLPPTLTCRMMRDRCLFAFVVLTALWLPSSLRAAERATLSLDGLWDIEDSKEPEKIPAVWKHKAPVPGLAHSSQPAFPHVDEFDSRMLIQNRVSAGKLPQTALVSTAGVSHQDRNYFWYRTTFGVPNLRRVAVLHVNKAQFGIAVWLNGAKIGEHLPCFTAAILDVSKAIQRGSNELIVRVGAPPGGVAPNRVRRHRLRENPLDSGDL